MSSTAATSLPAHLAPANFHQVMKGVYRSAHPHEGNCGFLLNDLKPKTVITLVNADVPEFKQFLIDSGITQITMAMASTKQGIDMDVLSKVVKILMDRENHPILVHCNEGNHRTGCVVGALRKVKGWTSNNILEEYKGIAEPKVRDCDVKFLRELEVSTLNFS